MSEPEEICFVDDAGSVVVPPQLKNRQRKSTAGARKIKHSWTDEEINRLIESVEQHRGLWDFASPEYKLAKLDGWRSVADEMGIDGVDGNEAKVKWCSLRTTFMVNLSNLRKRKSGQGANECFSVTWKFFKAMMFLEKNNIENSTSSTSTLQLKPDSVDLSTAIEFLVPSTSPVSENAFGNGRKRPKSTMPTPPPSPYSASSTSQAISILNNAVAALSSNDANTTFCDNLLAELRTLSEAKSRTLRYKISRLMMDFIEENQEVPKLSPVQSVDQNGQDAATIGGISE